MAIYDPSECYELSQFGVGPFPSGGTVVCPTAPPNAGYGGAGYGVYAGYGGGDSVFLTGFEGAISGGYGGDPYGHGPYGSGLLPRIPVPVSGGYGGDPYGTGPYGSTELIPPSISSAISLDGFRIEIFFSEEMFIDAILLDPTSYVLTGITGAAPTTVLSVEVGVTGTTGATSVIITHTGTTLGGFYSLTITGPTDLSGNPIEGSAPQNTVSLLTLGDPPNYTITVLSGSQLLVDFDQDMLTEAEFSPGIEELTAYAFTTTYPQTIEVTGVTHPYNGDFSQVLLDVIGMTSVEYTSNISPAIAIDYDGSILPDASTEFTGIETGTGTSSIVNSELVLNKNLADVYGWTFEDTSGRILPGSSYRVDFEFDASQATFDPPLFDAVIGALHISDGAIQASIILERIAGVDSITIISGTYTVTFAASWSTGPSKLTLVRNQKADTFAFLFNDTPTVTVLTGFYDGVATINPGAQFLLDPSYEVTGFPIQSLSFSATQTVFSGAWNFLHDNTFVFAGSGEITRNAFLTGCGPLVKGWGDATPATKNDVEVRVNGVPVEVESVNPYIGEIVLTIPIPLMPPGTMTVEVDYIWFPSPIMGMGGYNTLGSVYNKWDIHLGHHVPNVPGVLGALDPSRFKFSLVYGPIQRWAPIQIGHRYIGYERAYTASHNSPTTLLFNQNPHSVAVDTFDETPQAQQGVFDGVDSPDLDFWDLEGVDTGAPNGDGTYTVIDASSGSYGVGTATVYNREVDLSFDSSVVVVARYLVEDFETDGVFTGVGFGVHNNRRWYFVGNLVINGVQHIGLLTDIARPEKAESWEVGPTRNVEILDAKTALILTEDVPISLENGDRFQILSGAQSGVYTIENFIYSQVDNTTTIYIEESFPADPRLWSNDKADISFEVKFQDLISTYRLVTLPNQGVVQLYISGEISALAVDINRVPELAMPAESSLLLRTDLEGQVFWGSISRLATNESKWSFFRYDSSPTMTTFHSRGVVVSSEMNEVPEFDPNSEWFITQDFGYSEVDGTGGTLLLKSTAGSETLDTTFGYKRVEPFLISTANSDIDFKFRVDSGVLGAGDALVIVHDTNREVRFGTLQYLESGSPYRRLISIPAESFSGLQAPTDQGWSTSPTFTISGSSRGLLFTTVQALGERGTYSSNIDLTGLAYTDSGDRIIEARFAVTSYTALGTGETGIIWGGNAGLGNWIITATLLAPDGLNPARLALATSAGTPIQTYDFDWTDGLPHTYRILVDEGAAAVTLLIDDVVQIPTVALGLFDPGVDNTAIFFGHNRTDTEATVEWSSLSNSLRPPVNLKRTIGIWLGGDFDDIDNWAIPRTDAFEDEPNSSSFATIEEMDWRSDMEVRLHRDVTWGVTVLRPDLPLPPTWNGDFATQITEPSAGWITVEYPDLPRRKGTFGSISWGALDSRSITQQRWDFFRYRIYDHITDDFRSPHHMVYNQYNVITSGEALLDKTPQIEELESLTSTKISLLPTHIYADRIFKVIEGTTIIDFTQIEFDRETQIITLLTPLSGENVPVTVVYAPSKNTVTNTYLCNEPLKKSNTLLNEGTPPFPKHQTSDAISQVVFGSKFNDPNDTYNIDADFIYNDPYRIVQFTDEENSLYDCMEFCEITDSKDYDLLSSVCDDSFKGNGLVEFGLSGGSSFTDVYTGLSDLSNSFPGNPYAAGNYFTLSGGNPTIQSTYNNTIFWPNSPAGTTCAPDTLLSWALSINCVVIDELGTETELIDDISLAPTADNTPPSYSTDPNVVPDGTPGTNLHGAVLAVMVDAADYTRLGPWGGLASLEPNSLFYDPNIHGVPPNGGEFTLLGGSPLPEGTTTVFNIEAAN